ncbi:MULTISPECIES: helix-turn-helix domain-containing protein [Luteimonas]|uniref:helix-turn-helix domain-containing protein n=1 Tax=Luteimonas TaxID=83614 RepID=UPI000C7A609F|nr:MULTISPECIES: helix-turn-helix domain-containing protein [Luteimonas]
MKPLDALPHDDTFSLEQAAEYLHLGRDATRQLFDTGSLPGVSLNQKHLVFRRAALDTFLARMEAEQTKARAIAHRARMEAANDPAPPTKRHGRSLPDLTAYETGSKREAAQTRRD